MRYRIAIAAAALLAAGPVAAQEVLTAPSAIAECLCLWDRVQVRAADMSARKTQYEQAQGELTRQQQELVQARERVDTANPGQVQAFTDRLRRAEEARTRFNGETVPEYNGAITSYSEAATAYTRQCGGKSYDAEALAQAQRGLNCPR